MSDPRIERAERHYERVNELLRSGRLDDPRAFLGFGYENIPNKPFGYAHNMERQAIREHLRRRIWRFGLDDLRSARLEQRVEQIQRRLHREKPNLRERQEAWKIRCAARAPAPTSADVSFTFEELQHLVDLFTGANDPLSIEIARKAAAELEKRQ